MVQMAKRYTATYSSICSPVMSTLFEPVQNHSLQLRRHKFIYASSPWVPSDCLFYQHVHIDSSSFLGGYTLWAVSFCLPYLSFCCFCWWNIYFRSRHPSLLTGTSIKWQNQECKGGIALCCCSLYNSLGLNFFFLLLIKLSTHNKTNHWANRR